MSTKNFTNFNLQTSPLTGDYLVGYAADGSAELKTTIDNLASTLATSYFTSGGSSGDPAVNSLVHSNSGNWNTAYQSVSSQPYTLLCTLTSIIPIEGNNKIIPATTHPLSTVAFSVIAGGICNCITSCDMSLGLANGSPVYYSFIGGGSCNKITPSDTTNSGYINTCSGAYNAVIVGGCCNSICSGLFSVIVGGTCNTVSGYYYVPDEQYYGDHNFIGGGCQNNIIGNDSLGGISTSSAIVGGKHNTISSTYSFIGGGAGNCICQSAYASTIGGGYVNCIIGEYSTIGGGLLNTSSGYYSAIAGGTNNNISSDHSFIGGGEANCVCYADHSVITGGYNNKNCASFAIIGGGNNNVICNTKDYSVIAGGSNNTGAGSNSTISGGYGNTVCGNCAFIGGGQNNTVSGNYSAILGGANNSLSGSNSFILGSNLSALQPNFTYVNNISSQGTAIARGSWATSTYTGLSGDGVIIDYLQGTPGLGRISVGNGTGNDSLAFYNNGPGLSTPTTTMYLSSNGYVGINTNTPNTTLTVSGNLSSTGFVSLSTLRVSSLSATSSGPTTVAYKMPVYLANGTFAGWIPVYNG